MAKNREVWKGVVEAGDGPTRPGISLKKK